ncbi:MAG: DUF5807 family protein [Halovenus sp.]
MDPDREAFLAGERVDDVHIYLSDDAVSDPAPLEQYGERVEGGVVLVLDGEQARGVFRSATGIDPMAFAKEAMDTEGDVAPDCTGGICPAAAGGDHRARFVFAFAEAQNEEVGGLYADGPVVHAYVACTCGTRYSDKWLATEQ